MKTQTLVNLIQREVPSWGRTTILELINQIQGMLLQKPIAQTRIIDPDTGDDPILTTQSGVYQYDANETDITTFPTGVTAWFVDGLYTGTLGEDDEFIDIVTTMGTYNTPAVITFKEDPGVAEYKVIAYANPTQITSESVELSIPERWHLNAVYEGVIGWIQKIESGKSDRWDIFNNKTIHEFWYDMNNGNRQRKQTRYDGGY
jgi:hypothetical protein